MVAICGRLRRKKDFFFQGPVGCRYPVCPVVIRKIPPPVTRPPFFDLNEMSPMKPASRIFQFSTLTLLGIAIALVAQPVCAVPIGDIVITENSPRSLTVTYNGSTAGITVKVHSRDSWAVTFPGQVVVTLPRVASAWAEPENFLPPTFPTNIFSGAHFGPHSALIVSDFDSQFFVGTIYSDGTTVHNLGTDSANGGPINVTFFDKAEEPETVVDTGSALSLLLLAIATLFGVSRFRSLRLA